MSNRYQALRSVTNSGVIVICRDGEFYSLPDNVRHRGPWQGLRRGDVANLKAEIRSELDGSGFVLLQTSVAAFNPEQEPAQD